MGCNNWDADTYLNYIVKNQNEFVRHFFLGPVIIDNYFFWPTMPSWSLEVRWSKRVGNEWVAQRRKVIPKSKIDFWIENQNLLGFIRGR